MMPDLTTFGGVDLAVCLVLVLYALLWLRSYVRGGWDRGKLCFLFDSNSNVNSTSDNTSASADQKTNTAGINITSAKLQQKNVTLSTISAPLNVSLGDAFLKEYYATERAQASSIGLEGVKGGLLQNLGISETVMPWVLASVAFLIGWKFLR